jgi:hypothetical protein
MMSLRFGFTGNAMTAIDSNNATSASICEFNKFIACGSMNA